MALLFHAEQVNLKLPESNCVAGAVAGPSVPRITASAFVFANPVGTIVWRFENALSAFVIARVDVASGNVIVRAAVAKLVNVVRFVDVPVSLIPLAGNVCAAVQGDVLLSCTPPEDCPLISGIISP